ncbi:hypothetical protein O5D80_006666 [Batrachochytrium dendrobatidis]|nr:hypothetical protein O5D80_006666 [Batrachochytrium dendrobatidis]
MAEQTELEHPTRLPSQQQQPESNATAFPGFTIQHVNNCCFSSWYSHFSQCTFKSIVIQPLPETFIDYLNADGIYLPSEVNHAPLAEYDVDSDTSSEVNQDVSDTEEDTPNPSFPTLEAHIISSITRLGGRIFPKLNWSSPKDAAWITFATTLQCTTPADIFLLLKSSDFIAHDLSHAYEECVDFEPGHDQDRPKEFELVLREWFDLAPSMQFRCFVHHGDLVGMCQRDSGNYFEFLKLNRNTIELDLCRFFDSKISGKFPDPSYVFDVYMNARTRNIWLMDFNPFGPTTDALLYTWQEILESTESKLRIVESTAEAEHHAKSNFSHNRLPKEVFDLSNNASIHEFPERFKQGLLHAQFDKVSPER